MLIVWAVISSGSPWAYSFCFLAIAYIAIRKFGLILPSTLGLFTIEHDGRIRHGQYEYQLSKVHWYWLELKLVIESECGEQFTFWRDSLPDQDYRQLILLLKQWRRSDKE